MIEVVEEINESDIPPTTKANALALLSLAHPDNGHVAISWEDLARAFGHISIARTRKHMSLLQASDLIHYSSNGNGMIYVNFKAWVRSSDEKRPSHARKTTIPRAKNDHPTRDEETAENDSDHPTREKRPSHARKTTTPRAENDHDLYASAQAVSLLVSSDPNQNAELTNKPTKHQPWEAPLSYRLLTDKRVTVSPKIAQRLAVAHPFWEIRDAVAHWYCGRKSAGGRFETTPGIVITWLDRPDEFTIPTLSDEFRRCELYRDHRTPDELAAEQAALDEAQRLADEEAPPAAATPEAVEPAPGSPEAYWQQVRKELEIEQAGSFDRWLDGTYVLAYIEESNAFGIVLPDAMRADWVRNRLSKQIVRKLSVITRRPALVEFIIPESVSRETQSQGDSA
jgi:hypothetical protein